VWPTSSPPSVWPASSAPGRRPPRSRENPDYRALRRGSNRCAMSVSERGAYRRPEQGGSIWRVPVESDPRQLTLARRLLRLEAYLVPAGGGLLVGMAIAGAGSSRSKTGPSPEVPCCSGSSWSGRGRVLGGGQHQAGPVRVGVLRGGRAPGRVILAAAAVTYEAVWGAGGALVSAERGGAAAPGFLTPTLPSSRSSWCRSRPWSCCCTRSPALPPFPWAGSGLGRPIAEKVR